MAAVRRSGILLHPTSLPGGWGIGDFGAEAVAFLDWLADAGQTLWQLLPLGPVGPGYSPYSSPSSFAGNPLLISPRLLADEGLLPAGALARLPDFGGDGVDYATVIEWKDALLRIAWQHANGTAAHRELVDETRALDRVPGFASWLPDWALYAALKRRFEDRAWSGWPRAYRLREEPTLEVARHELEDEIHFHHFTQLIWARQWSSLQRAAAERSILIVGDLPIFPSLDSADVWAHRELFDLDAEGAPNALAGVPPDAYSDDGQSWGVPLYRWDRAAGDGFAWWIERLRLALSRTDIVRLDHFRGYAASWRIPLDAASAKEGAWSPGPGAALFEAAREKLGALPLIAEDLGEITPDVDELRRALGIPATRVLQFAFDELDSEHLPHNLERDTYLYSATHDNATTCGWLADLDDERRTRISLYAGGSSDRLLWPLLRCAAASVAQAAIYPIQDVLGLDDSARMNVPATAEGNWRWRLASPPDARAAERLRSLAEVTGRLPGPVEDLEPDSE